MANDPQTFAELKTSLINRAERDDLEENAILEEVIAEVERRFQRDLWSPERETTDTLSATDGTAALPADFMGVRSVYVDGDTPLERVTPSRLREMFPTNVTGAPGYFAIEGESLILGPAWSGDVELAYVQKLVPLSDEQPTNWLLTDHPDLYIHACLAEIWDFYRDPNESSREHEKTSAIFAQVNRSGRRRLTNSGPLRASSPVVQVSRFIRA